MLIKIIYTLFVGILIIVWLGFGIDAYYPQPKPPEPPVSMQFPNYATPESKQAAVQDKEWAEYEKAQRAWEEKMKVYSRNVSAIALAGALVILVFALSLLGRIEMVADGILLGGVFALFYSMSMGLQTGNSKYIFILAAIELVTAVTLGYLIFVKPQKAD